jgi:D-glycerate 3-kinase
MKDYIYQIIISSIFLYLFLYFFFLFSIGQDQDNLACNSLNPLLKFRGNAGTHDLELINKTFENLKHVGPLISHNIDSNCSGNNTNGSNSISIPRYDKSLRSGRGDRANIDTWV